MKKALAFFFIAFSFSPLFAQNQAETFIKEAEMYLTKKEYKQAQLSLQDALNEINLLIAKQIAAAMPAEINGLKAESEGEVNIAAMGMAGGGMSITKNYRNPSKTSQNAEIQILANSPLLAGMQLYLSNPSMLGQEYRSVRIGTNRAILKSETQDSYENDKEIKIRSTEIQVPLGQTIMTIHTNGFASEKDELDFATKLDLEKLKAALGE